MLYHYLARISVMYWVYSGLCASVPLLLRVVLNWAYSKYGVYPFIILAVFWLSYAIGKRDWEWFKWWFLTYIIGYIGWAWGNIVVIIFHSMGIQLGFTVLALLCMIDFWIGVYLGQLRCVN